MSPRAAALLLAPMLLVTVHPARAQPDFLGKSAAQWQRELNDPTPDVRRGAAFALGKTGAPSAVAPLLAALGDEDAGVRDAAAYALGDVAAGGKARGLWREAGPELVRLLGSDGDAKVRRSAAYALGCIGPDAAGAAGELTKALGHKDPAVRQNAARALGRLRDKAGAAGVGGLAEALRDDDPVVRRDAAAALGEVGGPAARPALRALVACFRAEKKPQVRPVALNSLVALLGPDDKALARDLGDLLKDDDRDVRRGAAVALGKIGGPEAKAAVPVLLDALRDDDDAAARELAAAGLGNIGESAAEAVPALGRALSDRAPEVRRNAALALAKVGRKSAPVVRALARALDAREPAEVRLYAAEAIGKTEEAVNEVVPELIAALKDDREPTVRQRAALALAHVRPRDFEKGGAKGALGAVLDESGKEGRVVRYDCARVLANVLEERAPPKAVAVLAEMLDDTSLRLYRGTDPTLKTGREGDKAGTGVKEDLGGDARFLAGQALADVAHGGARKDAVAALKRGAESKDEVTRKVAEEWLKKVAPE